MSEAWLIKIILIFLTSFIFSILINRLFLKFSKNLGIRNIDDQVIRWKTTSKPSFGGISMFIVFLMLISLYSVFFPKNSNYFDIQLIGIIVATCIGFLIGLTDDAYNTNPLLKSLGQAVCALVLIFTGSYINLFDVMIYNYLLTFIWIVGLMNSINMLDNMDGVATVASLSALTSMLIVIFYLKNFEGVSLVLVIGTIGALNGFLFFNWNPSKMYMGDTGSQFLGILLAALSINYLWNYNPSSEVNVTRQFLLPALAFVYPLSDTTTVVINRLMRKTSPFVGGRDHTTHHLSYAGLSDSLVAFTVGGIGLISSTLILLVVVFDFWNHMFTILFGAYILLVFLSLFLVTKFFKAKDHNSNES